MQAACVWGTLDIRANALNSITSKTRPTFGSPREMRLIHNTEVFLQRRDGWESTPRRATQVEEIALYNFMHIECGQWGLQVGGRRARHTGKELNFLSDLGDVQGSGHFLQLRLHRAVAERSLQNRLLDSQELAHLLQICKMHTINMLQSVKEKPKSH